MEEGEGGRQNESKVLCSNTTVPVTPQGALCTETRRNRCRLVDGYKSKTSEPRWKVSQAIKEKVGGETNTKPYSDTRLIKVVGQTKQQQW